ncbi:3'-5' exonuclease (plasmid) [Acinetobacter baumannii]|uniref:3'-5' exonuclease n=1 Tax=Acinetobacter baumannii TaxID=470 RepID=UPI000D69E06E|nr:3'-5' exonuclease [Acinetobacter baumannii]
MTIKKKEVFISVDVETSGPIPGDYDLLSIGMCLVDKPTVNFYCELKPISNKYDPEALSVTGFNLDTLLSTGLLANVAMAECCKWIDQNITANEIPIFVGFNVGFDWSFINYYFHKYLGNNPFGYTSVDIKSMYFGCFGGNWSETKSSNIVEKLKPKFTGNHHALHDAIFQAELFNLILEEVNRRG